MAINYMNPYMATQSYGNWQYPSVQPTQAQGYAYAPQPQMQQVSQNYGPGIIWVDGEVGAKAFQMPPGWPANVPIALWDTNEYVIYLKSINQMGMPNPLEKIPYTRGNQVAGYLPSGGQSTQASGEHADYMTREDFGKAFDELKNEMREMMGNRSQTGNQNAANNQQNRGGNR